jgi:hypothetical protein
VEEIGKALPAVFRHYLLRVAPPVVGVLAPLWPHVVGNGIAQRSRPVGFQSGVLKLASSCPAWAVQLRGMSAEIRAQVNRYLGRGVVKKVSIRYNSRLVLPENRQVAGNRPSIAAAVPTPGALPRKSGTQSMPEVSGAQRSRGGVDLDPEVAGIIAESFRKYFSRSPGAKLRSNV